jgi:hypothetical protein
MSNQKLLSEYKKWMSKSKKQGVSKDAFYNKVCYFLDNKELEASATDWATAGYAAYRSLTMK